ncbi:NAD+ synthetase [Enterococcus ureilyticus]|uniref:NAD+ synthetase n=1 Tax=Enterococcus ureilyticus TaxID=1131292 RepID=A0A1E5HG55_9ENTE|nr:ATP-binding cassette domain-containing protein [Enterococcus ureilyticus]MBM7687989.1 ABC-type dipeptide/oligopeptide/nickel transport system ATPase subunit [Enterococcus ureilyticus]MBO0445844.1 ATP-binding cassette domain-containing protein [Enterococcus ureilyticus]OEG23938.1 NAD+ synthetase [Enterococcus ureilyticus]
MNKNSSLLKIDKLSKTYKEQIVFQNLDLVINQGEWVGVIGKNGSGKSTLTKIILGLETYSEGEIHLNGQKQEQYELRQWMQNIQLVAQYTRNALDPTKKIEKILQEPLRKFRLVDKSNENLRIKKVLDDCHLPKSLLTKRPRELSGGQYQRVCIALSLLVKPKLLICDEATASLDKINELRIIHLLKKQQEMSVLFISHNKKLVNECCDNIFLLEH